MSYSFKSASYIVVL